MDVLTDIFVVSFPVVLLWKVRINLRQKIGLGISLCLSFMMVIIAIIRIAGIRLENGTVDIVWLASLEQQECSIAVIMVSVSAFRSLFVANTTTNPSPKPYKSPPHWRKRFLQKEGVSTEDSWETGAQLPEIPSATLTGMRTIIEDARISRVSLSGNEYQASASVPRDSWVHGRQHDVGQGFDFGFQRLSLPVKSYSNERWKEGGNIV